MIKYADMMADLMGSLSTKHQKQVLDHARTLVNLERMQRGEPPLHDSAQEAPGETWSEFLDRCGPMPREDVEELMRITDEEHEMYTPRI